MPTEILMPALSPTMEEGTLAKWMVSEGDAVNSGDLLAEIETDKATMEFEAVDDGVIGKLLVAAGSTGVPVNTPIAILVEDGESITPPPPTATPIAQPPAPEVEATAPTPVAQTHALQNPKDADRVFASPLARRLAGEKGIDLKTVIGSGPHGRVVKSDLEQLSSPTAAAPAAGTASSKSVMALYADREFEEVTLDNMRKTIAARLTEAKQTIPHFYLRRTVTIDALLNARAKINEKLGARGGKLSVNDFIIKAAAIALQEIPDANAVWAGDRILRLSPSDVAVAVAVEGGLFTPVLRDAEKKSLSALSAEMKDLASRAKSRRLAPNEYQGGSFSISNLGMMGIDNFDAVINPPHGSILAVGAGMKKPVVSEDGSLTTATRMSLNLSVDHRVIDGALGAQFLAAIVTNLENPLAMLV